MAHKDGKIILYAQQQKLDPIPGQKMAEVEEKKNTKYEIHDGLLYFINKENKRLCLRKGIIHDLIDECHEMYAHIGPLKFMKMLNDFFYYPKMTRIVR